MDNDNYFYFIWQCLLVLISGVTGLVAVFIKTNLPINMSVLFAGVFTLCIITALFFLAWNRLKKRQDWEDNLIDSIGENLE